MNLNLDKKSYTGNWKIPFQDGFFELAGSLKILDSKSELTLVLKQSESAIAKACSDRKFTSFKLCFGRVDDPSISIILSECKIKTLTKVFYKDEIINRLIIDVTYVYFNADFGFDFIDTFDVVEIDFSYINEYFGLPGYEFNYSKDNLIINHPVDEKMNLPINDELTLNIEHAHDGLIRSTNIQPSLEIKQSKKFSLSFSNSKNTKYIIELVRKVQLFFEYAMNTGIVVSGIYLRKKEMDSYQKPILLIFDDYLLNDRLSKYDEIKVRIQYKPYKDQFNVLFNNWIDFYDKYQDSIMLYSYLWKYSEIDKTEKFLWVCKIVESFCQNDDEIRSLEKEYKSKKHSKNRNLNIKDWLIILNDQYFEKKIYMNGFDGTGCSSSDLKPFLDRVKELRDKLTHYNPSNGANISEIDKAYGTVFQYVDSFFTRKLGIFQPFGILKRNNE